MAKSDLEVTALAALLQLGTCEGWPAVKHVLAACSALRESAQEHGTINRPITDERSARAIARFLLLPMDSEPAGDVDEAPWPSPADVERYLGDAWQSSSD